MKFNFTRDLNNLVVLDDKRRFDKLDEQLENELKLKGNLRAFIIGSLSGLAAGFIICGQISAGIWTLLCAGFLELVSQPKYQRIENL